MSANANDLKPDTQAESKARLRLWLQILKTSKQIEAQLRESLRAEFQSTLPRFDVLAALHRHPDGLKMSELSGVLRVSNGNVTGIIDRLVGDALVERIPVPGDRRAMCVRLTDGGIEHFETLAAAHETWVDDILSAVPPGDIEALQHSLQKITDRSDPS